MILSELNNLLINVARSNYLVNEAFVGDVYTINSKENKFGCFVATPMTGVKMALGTIRYRYVLYYIDRLTKKEDNIDFVQSDAVSVLKGIIDFFQEYGIEVVEGYEFTLFRQKFSDWCAGAYLNVSFVVPDNDCGEGDFNTEGIDLKPLVVDQNGIYEPGFNAGYNHVTVNVPQQGATQEWVLSQISSALSGFQATSESLGGVIVGPGLQVSDSVLTPKVGDAMDTLLCINEGGYLAVDLMWFYSGVTGIVANEGYAKMSEIGSEYVKLRNQWGSKSMNFSPSSPYIHMRLSVGNQLNIRPQLIDMFTTTQSAMITPTTVGVMDFSTSTVAGMWYDENISNAVLGIRDNNSRTFLKMDQQNFYLGSNEIVSLTIPISEIATQTWVQSQGYLTSVSMDDYATKSWVGDQNYLTSTDLTGYATQTWVGSNFVSSTDLSGYATKNWVGNQGYLTSVPSEYATKNWVGNQGFLTTNDMSSYATKNWVGNQGYLTSVPSGYATQSWVSSNFVSSTALTGYATQSWVESTFISASAMDDYLLKTNGNGNTSMVFGPDLPYIYLKSGGNNMTLRPYQIAIQGPNAYAQVLTNQITLDESTTHTMAGVWFEPDQSTCVLGVRDHSNEIGLMMDCRNIYLENSDETIDTIPISGLATQSWVQSQGYLTSVSMDDYATQSWVSSNYFEESKIWTGTSSAWASLTSSQRAGYTIALITE